jgi:twinkle protein
VVAGEVTIVTGVPNSGKSEWLDALAVNLAESAGWRFAMASMEKKPRDHARQLLEKRARKPLLEADYARGVPQMSPEVRGSKGERFGEGWVRPTERRAVVRSGATTTPLFKAGAFQHPPGGRGVFW